MICFGRLGVRLQEQIDEQRLDRRRIVADPVIARCLGPAQFQPVQRRLAGHRRTVAAPGFQLAGQHRHHRVVAQLSRGRSDPRSPARCRTRAGQPACPPRARSARTARPSEAGSKPIHQPNRPVRRSQQQRTGVRRDPPAVEAATTGGRSQVQIQTAPRYTLSASGLSSDRESRCSQNNSLQFGAPMHLPSVRYPG